MTRAEKDEIAALKAEVKRMRSELKVMGSEYVAIGWITREAHDRLLSGGNGSRGTVPMHHKFSCVATIPLYRIARAARKGKRTT